MRIKLLIALFTTFVVLGAAITLINTSTDVQLRQIDAKTKQNEINTLNQLNEAYQEELENSEKDVETLEELRERQRQLEEENQRLQQELAIKRARESENASSNQNKVLADSGSTNCDELKGKLKSIGVSDSDMSAAIYIAQKESGCRTHAINSSSGACGEFQSLPCGKWGQPGTDEYLNNAINYANVRYGGWWGAYNFWINNHWW